MSRMRLIDVLMQNKMKQNDCKGCKWRETLDFVKRIVKSSKTIDAVPVVHGHWITEKYKYDGVIRCSVCKKAYIVGYVIFSYCPNCGAKMDENGGE